MDDLPIRIERARRDDDVAAGIYARISSPKNHSVENQITDCKKRCAERGWPVRYVLSDVDESGANPDRPGLDMLMEHVAAGHITHVVTWKIDRLARTLKQAANIAEYLRERGVHYHSVMEPFDTSTVYGRFMFGNLATAAQLERELNQERMSAAFGHKARRGEWFRGQIPFGYCLGKGRALRVKPSEARLVVECHELYCRRGSFPEVAADFNARSVAYRDRRWSTALVQRILERSIYEGTYELAGETLTRPNLRIVPAALRAKTDRLREKSVRNGKQASQSARLAAIDNVFSQYIASLGEAGAA
jgi:DNA invertase Pin-like site-specific DNA recombinase